MRREGFNLVGMDKLLSQAGEYFKKSFVPNKVVTANRSRDRVCARCAHKEKFPEHGRVFVNERGDRTIWVCGTCMIEVPDTTSYKQAHYFQVRRTEMRYAQKKTAN